MMAATAVAGTAMAEAVAVAVAGRIGDAAEGVAGGDRAAERETPASIVFLAFRGAATQPPCKPRAVRQTAVSGSR
jgi:hypothetical protein